MEDRKIYIVDADDLPMERINAFFEHTKHFEKQISQYKNPNSAFHYDGFYYMVQTKTSAKSANLEILKTTREGLIYLSDTH